MCKRDAGGEAGRLGGGGCGGGGGGKGKTTCENNYVHIRIALELFGLRCLASLYDL